jgi:Cu/Ag efflux pump CusA
MRAFLESAVLKFGGLVLAGAVGLMVIGLVQMRGAPVDVYPEFNPPSVQIQTEALGLSAAEVEQLITLGLEQDLLNGTPWLESIHSSSQPGLSVIDLVFEPGTNIYAARQMVQERLTQAHALPNVGTPPIMIEPLASTSRVAMVGLSSKQVSLIDMSVLARWKIKPKLMGIPGVANVSVFGQRDRQLQVQVDPARLRSHGVSLTQVIGTAGNALWVSPLTFVEASTPGTGGFVESSNQRLAIQHVLPISSPADLEAVPVEGTKAGALRLGDVATVVEDHQPLIGDAVVHGTPSLYMVIEKFPDANTVQVARDVEAAMASLAPGLSGITVDTSVYRPATFIESALRNLGVALLIGLLLMIAALFAVFASWRAAVISLVAVPVSLTAAAFVLYLRGTTFTTMTLIGLAIALCVVIDDAIVDVDAVRRRLGERREQADDRSVASAIVETCLKTRGTLFFATLIILLAAVPVVLLSNLSNAFTRPLVLTFALAVLASMVVALTVTPTLATLLFRDHAQEQQTSPFERWAQRTFDRGSASFGARPHRAWIAVAVLAVAALAVIPQLGRGGLLPVLQDRNLLIQVHSAPGTGLTEMGRVTNAMTAQLRDLRGVNAVGAHVGRAVTSDQTVDVNSAEIWLTMAGSADYSRTQSAIRDVIRGYPGLRSELLTYPSDRVATAAAKTKDDLVVRVSGQDLGQLQTKAEEVRAAIADVPGVIDAKVNAQPQQPTVDIEVDLAAAERHGLKPGDIRREATTLTSGLIVGNLYEQAKIFDVVVWGGPASRHSLTNLENLLIDTPSGDQVRLKDVASVKIQSEPTAITHDEVSRSIDVVASVRGRNQSDVVADVKGRVGRLSMPAEFHMQVLGNATVHQADQRRTLAYGLAATVGIFLLLQAAAGAWRRAALLLLTIPLACVGAVLTAPLAGGIHSAGAIAGIYAVLCLAVRAGVQLVRRIAELERERDWSLGHGAALVAARERAVPVARTAVTTAVVLLPAVVLGGRAGLEMLRPFAVTVLGGLVTMTIVTLVVLPALDLAGSQRRARKQGQTPAVPGARTGGGDVADRPGVPSKGMGPMNMKRSIVAALAAIPLLAGCAAAAESAADDSPVKLTAVKGTDLLQVSLTAEAEQRLGLATDKVRAVADAPAGTSTVPYAAVIYDSLGATWTYTNSRPHTYVRAPITVDRIEGDLALLTAGPEVGTAVVVVGAPELLGAEMQIAGEE